MSFKGDHEQLFDRCSCGRRKMKNEYACEVCYRQGRQPEKLSRFGEFIAPPRRDVRNQGIGGQAVAGLCQCDFCPPQQFAECRECVLTGRLLACEWATVEDVK